MMRRVLLTATLAVAALAVAVAPAAAHKGAATGVSHKFTGSETAEPRFAGESQEFIAKPFTITCEKAKSSKTGATTTFPSENLLGVIKYSDCTATAALRGMEELELKAKFAEPVDLNFHANGYVEVGSGGTVTAGKLEGAGEIEIKLSGAIKCTIDLEAGTYPVKAATKPEELYEAAKFTPEEVKVEKGKKVTVKHNLSIATTLTKIPYEFEGEFCEAFNKTEGKNGEYTGTLLAELPKGNLGWE